MCLLRSAQNLKLVPVPSCPCVASFKDLTLSLLPPHAIPRLFYACGEGVPSTQKHVLSLQKVSDSDLGISSLKGSSSR